MKNKIMKTTFRLFIGVFLVSFLVSSCSASARVEPNARTSGRSNSAKPLPPGQAKKVTGEKSARNHAPGRN